MTSRALASRDWRRPAEPGTSTGATTATASQQQHNLRESAVSSRDHRIDALTSSNWPRRDAGHRNGWSNENQASHQPAPTNNAKHTGNAASHLGQRNDQQDVDYAKRIYLGNLLYCAREEDITGLLGDAGLLYTKVVISVDPFTSRNPSYCFVDFATTQEALNAITSLYGRPLLGRPVKTRPAVPSGRGSFNPDFAKKPTRAMREAWLPAPPESDDSGKPAGDPSVFKRWERKDAADFFSPDEGTQIIVSGLPNFRLHPPTVQTNVRALLDGFAVIAISKILPPTPGLEHYGHMVYVQLDGKTEAERAVDTLHQTIPPWGGLQRIWVRVSTSSGSWKTHQRSSLLELEGGCTLAV